MCATPRLTHSTAAAAAAAAAAALLHMPCTYKLLWLLFALLCHQATAA
jgi:hypothetical protein